MRAGARRHKITIQERTVTAQGTRGEDVYTWTQYAIVWMEVRGLTGREVYQFAQMWPNAQAMLNGNYTSGVTSSMRAYDSCCTRTFEIKEAMDPEGKRRSLQLLCQEVTL